LDSSLDVLCSKAFYKEHGFAKEIVNTLVLHTPENIIGSSNHESEFSAVFKSDMDVKIVVLGVYLRQVAKIVYVF
jgi:hypothetical protein